MYLRQYNWDGPSPLTGQSKSVVGLSRGATLWSTVLSEHLRSHQRWTHTLKGRGGENNWIAAWVVEICAASWAVTTWWELNAWIEGLRTSVVALLSLFTDTRTHTHTHRHNIPPPRVLDSTHDPQQKLNFGRKLAKPQEVHLKKFLLLPLSPPSSSPRCFLRVFVQTAKAYCLFVRALVSVCVMVP